MRGDFEQDAIDIGLVAGVPAENDVSLTADDNPLCGEVSVDRPGCVMTLVLEDQPKGATFVSRILAEDQ